jgi:hypothetical protein
MPVLSNSLPVFDYPYKEGLPARHNVPHLVRTTNIGLSKFYSEMLELISTFEFPGVLGRVILNRILMQSM